MELNWNKINHERKHAGRNVKPISAHLEKYRPPEKSESSRPVNLRWEKADEFGKYVGMPTPFVMRLFKMFGEDKVLGQRSWFKDCGGDPKRIWGLAMWRMKEVCPDWKASTRAKRPKKPKPKEKPQTLSLF